MAIKLQASSFLMFEKAAKGGQEFHGCDTADTEVYSSPVRVPSTKGPFGGAYGNQMPERSRAWREAIPSFQSLKVAGNRESLSNRATGWIRFGSQPGGLRD